MANSIGTGEITQTFTQACQLDVYIQDQVADGLQILDALNTGLKAYPLVNEWIHDWETFRSEVGDLTREEFTQVYQDVSAGLTPDERQRSRVFRVLDLLTFGGDTFFEVKDRGQLLFEKAKAIIA